MAVTFSTDSYWDAAGRIAGEAVTINSNATVTIRTDTRWYPSAPASMTGTIASVTVSTTQGGKMKIDGTNVRWMPFDTGSGNVPAIGTSITQGGVSGYLLAVYASITSAPTAVGAAMPASGFLKFREVTGGQYSAGALTGIDATATSADVPGWIEVVFDSSGAKPLNFGQLGTFEVTGEWFDLGTTSGSAQQIISVPTNGGTGGISGIQIETSPGSGVYEWYSGQYSDKLFTTAKIATDKRGRFFCSDWTNSRIIIGGDGTNLIGYVPAAGCKIRMPNVLLRIATAAARATNLRNPADAAIVKPGFTTGTYAFIIDKCHFEIDFNNGTDAGSFTLSNSVFDSRKARFDNVSSTSSADNCLFMYNAKATSYSSHFSILNSQSSITISNCMLVETDQILYTGLTAISKASNVVLENIDHWFLDISTGNTYPGLTIDGTVNCNVSNYRLIGGDIVCTTNKGLSLTNIDFTGIAVGTTGTVGPRFGITLQNNDETTLDGVSLCMGGQITNAHPYAGVVKVNGTLGKNYVRNIGTRLAPVNCGSINRPAYLLEVAAGTKNLKAQRCYADNLRTNLMNFSGATSTTGCLFEHIYSDSASASYTFSGVNCVFKNLGLDDINASAAGSNYGMHWADGFLSPAYTTGKVAWFGSKPSSLTSGENYIYSPGGTSRYLAPAAQVMLNTVGDYFYSEMTYMILGHDSFQNTAPVLQGTNTNLVTYEYQIDTGSGWNGTWKTLNASNLSGESISPSTGFKFKFRGTLTSAGTAQINSIRVATNSSTTSQTDNLYVLDTASVTLTGLVTGSEVRAYAGTDPSTAVEVGGTESTGGSTFTFTQSVAGQDGHIVILAMGYQPIYLPYTYGSTDASLLIQPVIDRNYNNPI